jgi:NTP pyrophosphatase (non-canonical NTP hydrolase)
MRLSDIQKIHEQFCIERDWEKFHSVKNLSMALAVESSELLELSQWLTEKESNNPSEDLLRRYKEEIADIFLYLLRISDVLKIDLLESALSKIEINRVKYPLDKPHS